MAVSLLCREVSEVSDLCIGKPALRSLPPKATVGDALLTLKRCGESCLSVSSHDRSSPERKAFAGKICMVDIICYLCAEENIRDPAAALKSPVSALLPKGAALVRRVEPHSSLLEALDLILDGAQSLVVPIRFAGGGAKKKVNHHYGSGGTVEYCWLTQGDFVRHLFNSIALFSPVLALSVTALGLVRTDVLSVRHHQPALSAVPLIRRALAEQTSVAVVTDDGKLIGEISPSTLSVHHETVAAAVAVLSAGDLMAFIDCCGSPPEGAVTAVKARLKEKGMEGMLELMYEELSSSDEEFLPRGRPRRQRSGSYSARMGRRSEEAIVCHPGSSLVAVMVQALAHRVSYVWVVEEEDYDLVGIVAFSDVLSVLREQLR